MKKLTKIILLLLFLTMVVGCDTTEKEPVKEVQKEEEVTNVDITTLKNTKEDAEKFIKAINYQIKDEKIEFVFDHDSEAGQGQRKNYVYKIVGAKTAKITVAFYTEENQFYSMSYNIDKEEDYKYLEPVRDGILKAINHYDKCSKDEKCKEIFIKPGDFKDTKSVAKSFDRIIIGLSYSNIKKYDESHSNTYTFTVVYRK